jgi:hypothetical protein
LAFLTLLQSEINKLSKKIQQKKGTQISPKFQKRCKNKHNKEHKHNENIPYCHFATTQARKRKQQCARTNFDCPAQAEVRVA